MQKTKYPASPTGGIPVLFDIIERGAKAPPENKIKPPPPPEVSEFHLDDIQADSESPTVLPKSALADSTEFTLGSSEDITDEYPVIDASIRESNTTAFVLDNMNEDITEETPIISATMLKDSQLSADELVEQAIQEIMPQLESLARTTLYELVSSAVPGKKTDETQ